jgi:hypothetical protein
MRMLCRGYNGGPLCLQQCRPGDSTKSQKKIATIGIV